MSGPLGVALVVLASLASACGKPGAGRAPVVVRNPDYLVVRSIRREADSEHTVPVELPYAGAGHGFASSAPLLDLRSFDPGAATFAGGRTSIAGPAALWVPLTPEASRRLETWSARHVGDSLGIFLKGRLIAAPRIGSALGGGIPVPVAGKREGEVVLQELRNGGVSP